MSFADFFSNLRLDSLSRSYEDLQLDEIRHDLESHLAHLFCKIAYNNRRFYADDITIDLTLICAVIGRTFRIGGRIPPLEPEFLRNLDQPYPRDGWKY